MTDCLSLRDSYFGTGTAGPVAEEFTDHLQLHRLREAYEGLPLVDQALFDVASRPVSVPSFDNLALAAADAARQQRRRQTIRRSYPFLYTGGAAAAVAAAIVLMVTLASNRSRAPKLLMPGVEMKATAETKLGVLRSGARLRLESGAIKLAATPAQQETLFLDKGRVFLEVPKLAQGTVLSVRTPDAEVRVHGTRFEVVRTANNTEVRVAEGLVEVRPEGIGRPAQFVRAGESTIVNSAEAHQEALRRSTLEALDRGKFAAAEKQIESLLGSSANEAQRAEAQALLAWSIAARGKRAEAIERYRQALALLPEGMQPLWAENACAELALLVEHESPKSSGETWAECLRRFPNGVHTDLARSRARLSKGF